MSEIGTRAIPSPARMWHGKLILLGEHFVLAGAPALVVPAPLGVRVLSAQEGSGTCAFIFVDMLARAVAVDANTQADLGLAYARVSSLLSARGYAPRMFGRITLQVDLPLARGLGSSAAIGAAVASLLVPGLEADVHDLFRAVQAWEAVFHDTPSGVDAACVANERATEFLIRDGTPTWRPCNLPDWHVVVASAGGKAATRQTVGAVDPSVRGRLSQDYEQVFECATVALAQGRIEAFGQCMNTNHELLRQLGVSTERLDRMCDAATAAGALGAKLSGAGGGGVMFALVQESSANAVRSVLSTLTGDPAFGPQIWSLHADVAIAIDDHSSARGSRSTEGASPT